jgi:hypothetical protein
MISYAYDKARTDGNKHSAAVRDAVDFVKQLEPEIAISEAEVKRILAELRPSDGPMALLATYDILEGEAAATHRSRFAQIVGSNGSKNPSDSPEKDPARPLKRFLISYGKRPTYPRHNAKTSNS